VVTGERTYRLQEYHRLYQTKKQYEIFNTDTGGVESQIELTKVMWLEPAERPGYYDWDKRQYCYHEF
jgi:hypothetical protein